METIALETPSLSPVQPFTPWYKSIRSSVWVLIGYSFWFGFFLGAVIMHAIIKSI
ncbi:MAG TPA: hypothetical protein VMW43_08620 [Bacteroidota bacterium]|nr:hypothetical protein [Bacteroidota bacterium]